MFRVNVDFLRVDGPSPASVALLLVQLINAHLPFSRGFVAKPAVELGHLQASAI